MSAETQPAPRNLGGRPPGIIRRRRELVETYVAALGGPGRVSAVAMVDIERAVDLVMLARAGRAQLLKGNGNVTAVIKIENASDRALRKLNLPAPGGGAPVQTLADYLAGRHAASDEAEE